VQRTGGVGGCGYIQSVAYAGHHHDQIFGVDVAGTGDCGEVGGTVLRRRPGRAGRAGRRSGTGYAGRRGGGLGLRASSRIRAGGGVVRRCGQGLPRGEVGVSRSLRQLVLPVFVGPGLQDEPDAGAGGQQRQDDGCDDYMAAVKASALWRGRGETGRGEGHGFAQTSCSRSSRETPAVVTPARAAPTLRTRCRPHLRRARRHIVPVPS
jgi:hypothetical protein